MTVYERVFTTGEKLWSSVVSDIEKLSKDEFEQLITEDKKNHKKLIMEAIESNQTTFINGYNGKEEKLEAIVILDNGYICPVFTFKLCGLNKLYFSDGKIHLSPTSVAGNFGRTEPNIICNDEKSFMESAVRMYNQNDYFAPKIIEYRII